MMMDLLIDDFSLVHNNSLLLTVSSLVLMSVQSIEVVDILLRVDVLLSDVSRRNHILASTKIAMLLVQDWLNVMLRKGQIERETSEPR